MHPEINKSRRIKDAKEKTIAYLDKIIDEAGNRLAAKDAALRQCVEAIEKLTPEVNCLHGQLSAARGLPLEMPTGSIWMALLKADAALTAAKEALGDG